MALLHSIKYLLRRSISIDGDYYDINGYHHLKIIFVHIPKTGGVSISRSIFGSLGGGHTTLRDYQAVFGLTKYNRYFKFAFVRDPVSRFVSAMNYLKGGGMSKGDILWRDKYLPSNMDINTFVCEELHNHVGISQHFRRQIYYLVNSKGVLDLDFIGRFENLDEDFQIVRNYLNKKVSLSRFNVSKSNYYHVRQLSDRSLYTLHEMYAEDYKLIDSLNL